MSIFQAFLFFIISMFLPLGVFAASAAICEEFDP